MNNGQQIKMKKMKLQISYWLSVLKRNFFKYFMLLLFVFSIALSLTILIPNFLTHQIFMFGIETPRIFQVEGLVIIKKKDGEVAASPGCTLEIGGYKTFADQDGKYRLKFLAKSYDNIPVVIHSVNGTVIKRITFKWDEYKKTEEFIIDEK